MLPEVGKILSQIIFLIVTLLIRYIKSIYSGQLVGTHKFDDEKWIVEWLAGYNRATREQPDYRRFRSDLDPDTEQSTLYGSIWCSSGIFF